MQIRGARLNLLPEHRRIRDRALLTTALDVTPPFLRTSQAAAGLVTDYRNMSISLGRRFRSLKIWFALRSFGVAGFRAHLRKLNELAALLEREVRAQLEGVQLFTPRRFSLVVIRIVESSAPTETSGSSTTARVLARENALNARLIELANADHSIMLTPTTVGGYNCVRIAVGSPHTEEKHIRALVVKLGELVKQARKDVAA